MKHRPSYKREDRIALDVKLDDLQDLFGGGSWEINHCDGIRPSALIACNAIEHALRAMKVIRHAAEHIDDDSSLTFMELHDFSFAVERQLAKAQQLVLDVAMTEIHAEGPYSE